MLNARGEPAIKSFVQESVDQALHLERALARLNTRQRIVALHYSRIRDTVIGESPETFPFLGSTRLEGPLNRFQVDAVFHGHAHQGTQEGRTSSGIPVYNVAAPLLRRTHPDRPPFAVFTPARSIALPSPADAPSTEPNEPKDESANDEVENPSRARKSDLQKRAPSPAASIRLGL